jgi:hypothetical protein
VERLDVGELADTVLFEPGEERAHGAVIGHARVVLLERGRKIGDETSRRRAAGLGDDRRDDERIGERRLPTAGPCFHQRCQLAANDDTSKTDIETPRIGPSPGSPLSPVC